MRTHLRNKTTEPYEPNSLISKSDGKRLQIYIIIKWRVRK